MQFPHGRFYYSSFPRVYGSQALHNLLPISWSHFDTLPCPPFYTEQITDLSLCFQEMAASTLSSLVPLLSSLPNTFQHFNQIMMMSHKIISTNSSKYIHLYSCCSHTYVERFFCLPISFLISIRDYLCCVYH